MTNNSLEAGFLLRDFRVYPLDLKVVSPRGEQHVAPVAMSILCAIAKGGTDRISGALIEKQVWGDSKRYASSLHLHIEGLNDMLRQSPSQPDLIASDNSQTYWLSESPRLLNENAAATSPQANRSSNSSTTTTAGLSRNWSIPTKKIVAIALLLMLILLPLTLGFMWFSERPETRTVESATTSESVSDIDNSIAVLAFINLSDKNNYDYFGDGIAEEILIALDSTGKMLVAPRTSSFIYKDSKTPIKEIGQQLGVRYILDGSVRRRDDTVRVFASLIDSTTGFPVWRNTYQETLSDIFEVQQDISARVVRSLNIVLSPEMRAQLGASRTSNIEAYDAYLQARDFLHQPSTEESLAQANALFQQAIDLDPDYPDAYAGLCESFLGQYIETNTGERFSQAEKACKETLRFDVATIVVRIALGNLYRESGRYQEAQQQLSIALQKEPQNIDALSALAKTQAQADNHGEAEQLFLQAIEVQPRYWRGYDELGSFLFRIGRAKEAISAFEKVIELTPDNAAGYNNLGAALLMANQFEQAAAAWQRSLQIEVTESASSNAGSSLFLAGKFDEAATMYAQATQLAPNKHELWGNLADAQYLGSKPAQARKNYLTAIDLANDALAINPNNKRSQAILAHYSARVGENQRAIRLLDSASAGEPKDLYVWYYAALAWLTLDKLDESAQSLNKAIALGYPKELILTDQSFSALTSNRKFRSILGLDTATAQ